MLGHGPTNYRGLLVKAASGGNPLVREAILERARLMASKLAGPNPTPLEILLCDRVVSLWVLVELQEALNSAWYSGQTKGKTSPTFILQMVRLQGSAHRRYLQAIKTLAQIQKLRDPSRLQVNGVPFHTEELRVVEGLELRLRC